MDTRRARLLVAEDNPVNQMVARALLAKIGYEADVVANGAEALEALQRADYGAVLMDCQMPVMDGYAATAAIRAAEQGAWTPIIAMTASAMRGERERCLQVGMDDYVAKPVALGELEAVLRRWVSPPEARTQPPARDDAENVARAGPFDPDRVAALRALKAPGRPDMFLYLATIFVGQAGTCMAELGEALSRADSEHARLAAHALRGSAATIGALPLADLFAALEERLAAGGAAGPEAFAPIEEAFDRVRSWLERDGAVSATTSRPGAGDTALSSRSRG